MMDIIGNIYLRIVTIGIGSSARPSSGVCPVGRAIVPDLVSPSRPLTLAWNAFLIPPRFSQNGGKPDSPEEEDSVKRYIRNSRDLSRLVVTDTINT